MVFLILLLRDVHTAGFLMLPSNSIQDCHLCRVLSKLLLFLVFSFVVSIHWASPKTCQQGATDSARTHSPGTASSPVQGHVLRPGGETPSQEPPAPP